MLRVRKLSVRFQTAHGSFTAVDSVSFDLERGGSLALIGESGSGKTTTALSLPRLLPPNARATGRIELDGKDLLTLTEREMTAVRGRRIAMVFSDPLSALNPVHRIGNPELMAAVGLDRRVARMYPHQLSGGMRQRALIAMALARAPSLLIADEPTSALDSASQDTVVTLLRQVRAAGTALLVATHDLDLAARLCDEIAVMYGGRIVERGRTADVLRTPSHPYTRWLLANRPSGRAQRPSAGENLVEVKGLRVDRVLDGVSFNLAAGEFLAITGESGAGKSTLARAVLRLIPAEGVIRFRGRDVAAVPSRELRREMQLVFQEPVNSLDPRMTMRAILEEPLKIHGFTDEPEDLLRKVELGPELLDRRPHQLSGGQAQRVALARALATRPSLLVADEALSALDVSLQAQMAKLMLELRRSSGIACLFVTHDLRMAEYLCDRIAVLKGGSLCV